ncbi:MAG: double zinc ribbon-containing protein [Paenibacillus sp.]|jgi:RNA polymerase subunit RPABC4/transcription elongation factor Spt4|nr:double zinc ribbon-containing protein [Paenibacillus sp.]
MSFFDKLREGASKAADMAKDTVEVTRLNAQIASKRKEIEKLYGHIGAIVFEAYTTQNMPNTEHEIEQNCRLIADLNQEIEFLEHRIKLVKNEKDCVCGNVVSLDIKFCPKCGHKFDEEPPAPVALIEPEEKLCSSCGKDMKSGDKFCGNCGTVNP